MFDRLKETLGRLQGFLRGKTEDAYKDRDAASDSKEQAYAEGEAHAYGVASDKVRDAERANE